MPDAAFASDGDTKPTAVLQPSAAASSQSSHPRTPTASTRGRAGTAWRGARGDAQQTPRCQSWCWLDPRVGACTEHAAAVPSCHRTPGPSEVHSRSRDAQNRPHGSTCHQLCCRVTCPCGHGPSEASHLSKVGIDLCSTSSPARLSRLIKATISYLAFFVRLKVHHK